MCILVLLINRQPFEKHCFQVLSLACKILDGLFPVYLPIFSYVKIALTGIVCLRVSWVMHKQISKPLWLKVPCECKRVTSHASPWHFCLPLCPNLVFPLRCSSFFHEVFPNHFQKFECFAFSFMILSTLATFQHFLRFWALFLRVYSWAVHCCLGFHCVCIYLLQDWVQIKINVRSLIGLGYFEDLQWKLH